MQLSWTVFFMLVGLIAYLMPLTGWAARLNTLGLVVFGVAFAKWLGVL